MRSYANTLPVIDLFAGPGGLSEGFSRYAEFLSDNLQYKTILSIEKDEAAVRTLRLRAFLRQFRLEDVPDAYYEYIRSDDPLAKSEALNALRRHPEWRHSAAEVWKYALGDKSERNFFKLHRRIRRRLAGATMWVLLGGPPCQAYSVVGRARRLGHRRDLDLNLSEDELKQRQMLRANKFFQDERHTLYTEYLEIVAIHQPPFFVMENVKGILTSKISSGNATDGQPPSYIFERITRDLTDPWLAIRNEKLPSGWEDFADGSRFGYNLYSFTNPPHMLFGDNAPEDYLIKAEHYGIPQERHRVIIFGVREDVDAVPLPLTPRADKVTVQQVIGSLPPLRSGRSGRSHDGKRRDRSMDSPEMWADAVANAIPDETLEQIEPAAIREGISTAKNTISRRLTKGAGFIPWKDAGIGDLELHRWLTDQRLGGVIQHRSRDHMDSDFARYLFLAVYAEHFGESPKLRHFPSALLPKHRSVYEAGRKDVPSRTFADRFRVQVAGRPASTIVSHIQRDGHYYIHYDPMQCRSLTVREVARLQTFPDNYYFEGNKTEQYEQIGNAVPPFLALQLAAVVAASLRQSATITTFSPEQRLTSTKALRVVTL
ncbi:DNA cytosine methyltransferase [Methylorubrum salsuginis]|nr:DNA cytosine methyltransferase [Methylorubrum salsuginis]